MPTTEVDGTALFYRQYGAPADPPVLLVHGAGGTLMHWPPALRRLPGFAVSALDLPGHGNSGGLGASTIDAYAAVIPMWMDRVGLEQVSLIGHSMGGAIAQRVALTAPERVTALGLVATGARLPVAPALLAELQQDFPTATRRIATLAYAHKVDTGLISTFAEQLQAASLPVVYRDFLACAAFDARPHIGEITCPSLVICGKDDRMTPIRLSIDLAGAIPGAILRTLAGAGHMIMQEEPDWVASEIARFLRGYDAGMELIP